MFQDKVVVVTGAGGTLCSAISIELAKCGAKVVLVGRTKEKLDVVYEKIANQGGTAMVFPCDVTDQMSVDALAEEVKSHELAYFDEMYSKEAVYKIGDTWYTEEDVDRFSMRIVKK
jgi:NAD(P)-dependent dehydrogenase (short-subunit alcohol dehydrogenase family)